MKDKSTQLRATLAKMRITQRAKQKKADEEDLESLNTRTIFCAICKLNYSQEKSVHQGSEAHKVNSGKAPLESQFVNALNVCCDFSRK